MTTGELFGSHKIFEILVVSENSERDNGVLEEVSPFFETGNDSEEFFVIDFIIPFSGLELSGEESNRAELVWIAFRVLG